MTEINLYAVLPRGRNGGEQMHLLIVGYRSTKARYRNHDLGGGVSTLCAHSARTHWLRQHPTLQIERLSYHVPIAEALSWRDEKATTKPPFGITDPRSTWTWCPLCVGRFLQHRRVLHDVLTTYTQLPEEATA